MGLPWEYYDDVTSPEFTGIKKAQENDIKNAEEPTKKENKTTQELCLE